MPHSAPVTRYIESRQKVLLRSMLESTSTSAAASDVMPPAASAALSALVAAPSVGERQQAGFDRIKLMCVTLSRLFDIAGEDVEYAIERGVYAMLTFLNALSFHHALDNVFDTKCLSLELLGYLATSPEPDLPMPPKFFLGSSRSSQLGSEGFSMDSFNLAVLAAPHCVISDSIFGFCTSCLGT
jgi:hypothetical protein